MHQTPAVHSPGIGSVCPIYITLYPMLGDVERGDHKTMPSLVSVFSSDPLQVLCCFPNLVRGDVKIPSL